MTDKRNGRETLLTVAGILANTMLALCTIPIGVWWCTWHLLLWVGVGSVPSGNTPSSAEFISAASGVLAWFMVAGLGVAFVVLECEE